jgi:hypothetical protein
MDNIQIYDEVHARYYNEDRSQVAVQNFTVTAIEGTVYRGGALECDTSAGWSIELTRKSPINYDLPSTLSEITITDSYGRRINATGKGTTWRNDGGKIINLDKLVRWEEGHLVPAVPTTRTSNPVVDLDA